MPLFGKIDNAANSPLSTAMQYNRAVTTANQSLLFGNTKADIITTNAVVGVFGVSTGEAQANPSIPHSGWNIRKEGTGLRAGRVTYECLVAGGDIQSDTTDDTVLPDYRLFFVTQPSSNSAQTGFVSFTANASSVPAGAPVNYKWQRNAGAGWVDIVNAAGAYTGNTANVMTANVAVANANTIRVQVTATGANTIYSTNATVTLLP